MVNDIHERVDASVKLPEGYHIEYGGQFESEQAASRTLALTTFMTNEVIILLLSQEFTSVEERAIILINLPMKYSYNTIKASDINNLLAKSEKKENELVIPTFLQSRMKK